MRFYIDFDNTIVDSVARICDLYNDDFCYYDRYIPVNPLDIKTWEFKELTFADSKTINQYFTQPRFFNECLREMNDACSIINRFHNNGDTIIIVSSGVDPNLRLKKAWLRNRVFFDEFIGLDINKHKNKNHIDMKGGILIDDMTQNLKGSNAMYKICFGDKYAWNSDWDGIRCRTWNNVYDTVMEELL